MDIIKLLQEYEVNSIVVEPMANKSEAKKEYGLHLCGDAKGCDCFVFAVAHDVFKIIHGMK